MITRRNTYTWFICLFILSMLFTGVKLHAQNYRLNIQLAGKDSTTAANAADYLGLQTTFTNKVQSIEYINKIPSILSLRGFPAASVDTVYFDSLSAYIQLYTGPQYRSVTVNADSVEEKALEAAGWNSGSYKNQRLDFA